MFIFMDKSLTNSITESRPSYPLIYYVLFSTILALNCYWNWEIISLANWQLLVNNIMPSTNRYKITMESFILWRNTHGHPGTKLMWQLFILYSITFSSQLVPNYFNLQGNLISLFNVLRSYKWDRSRMHNPSSNRAHRYVDNIPYQIVF